MIEHYIVIIPSNIMDLLPMGLPPGQPRWTTLGGSRGEPLSCRRRGGEPGVSFSSSSRISRSVGVVACGCLLFSDSAAAGGGVCCTSGPPAGDHGIVQSGTLWDETGDLKERNKLRRREARERE
ncbi:uncharacterized protein LOC127752374 isoform X1 [Frankliniella occidentalis]|uniref:Uncharacterized protein LOC127752374 isoform X1 n=1 Tax=Frankliniella occidentalis TaxID=133901 RepID=A0A9C6XDP6_FRAOC|nr:uncharacterized protein LOC127752374 isoform X1 [Frankliniella occidentalis]